MQNEFDFDFSASSDKHFVWGNADCPYLKKTVSENKKICLTIKAMNLQTDILFVHAWANMPYSAAFWGMQHSSAEDIRNYYSDLIRTNTSYPFIVYCNDIPVAFFELYDIAKDALQQYIDEPNDDKGVHLLMAPPKYILSKLSFKIRNLSSEVLRFILEFSFSFTGIENMYAEPDTGNDAANRLAERCGFLFLKQISLPDKTANLYVYPKSQFVQDKASLPE